MYSGAGASAGHGEKGAPGLLATRGRLEIADVVQQVAKMSWRVHGRTKEDGYKAERINWQAIADIRQRLTIPVIANGETGTTKARRNAWRSPAVMR